MAFSTYKVTEDQITELGDRVTSTKTYSTSPALSDDLIEEEIVLASDFFGVPEDFDEVTHESMRGGPKPWK